MSEPAANPEGPFAAALHYLNDFGWSIIPICTPLAAGQCEQHGWCTSPGKVPLVAWARYQAAAASPHVLEQWWHKWPTANVGLVTGALSRVVVVDLDGHTAQAEAERLGGIPPGPLSLTGRIGGQHHLCAYRPDAPSVFAKRAGIDFRGQGGYAVLPPSLHESGNHYQWAVAPDAEPLPGLPDWIDELARQAPQGETTPRARLDGTEVEGTQHGARNDTLARLVGAWRYHEHLDQDAAAKRALEYARKCHPPLEAREALGVVVSIFRYPEHDGPVPPQMHEILGETWVQPGLPGFWDAFAHVLDEETEVTLQIVQGLLWGGRTHWLFGGPGAGKTIFGLALGMHLAAGKAFLGREVAQGSVAIVEEDSPNSVMADYARLLGDIYDIDPRAVPILQQRERGTSLRTERDLKVCLAALDELPADTCLVILDSCERIVPSHEFDSAELYYLGRFLAACAERRLASLVIDHTRKLQGSAENADPLEELYGGRAKGAISDVVWKISGKIANQAHLECVKFRGDTPAGIQLRFDDLQGFVLESDKVAFKPPEQQVMRVLNNARGWLSPIDIGDALQASGRGMHPKTLARALVALAERGALEVEGQTRARRYRSAGASTLWS